MKKVAFFDTKDYDREHFDKINKNFNIKYFKEDLHLKPLSLPVDVTELLLLLMIRSTASL